jgi:hypothetical protein
MAKIDSDSISALKSGEWLWEKGVGVYRKADGSHTWHIKYYHHTIGQKKEGCPGCFSRKKIGAFSRRVSAQASRTSKDI